MKFIFISGGVSGPARPSLRALYLLRKIHFHVNMVIKLISVFLFTSHNIHLVVLILPMNITVVSIQSYFKWFVLSGSVKSSLAQQNQHCRIRATVN